MCAPWPNPCTDLLTFVAPTLPITWVDFTSSGRTHFWRTAATERQLKRSLLVLHGQKQWDAQVRWAACTVAGSAPSAEMFNELRCEAAAPRFHALSCRAPPRNAKQAGHAPEVNRSECVAFMDERPGMATATWCGATGASITKTSKAFLKGHAQRPPPPAAFVDAAICNASEPDECTAANYDEPLLLDRARAAAQLAAEAEAATHGRAARGVLGTAGTRRPARARQRVVSSGG